MGVLESGHLPATACLAVPQALLGAAWRSGLGAEDTAVPSVTPERRIPMATARALPLFFLTVAIFKNNFIEIQQHMHHVIQPFKVHCSVVFSTFTCVQS